MFRRIVSNLSFSPALVGQLGFYARRLKKEEATRRLGLVFTALALVVQSLSVFNPPEAANAASAADFIPGGVSSKQEFMGHYNNNTNRIEGLFSSLGITKAEVAAMQPGTITKGEVAGKYNWSRTSLYSAAQGQRSYTFNRGAGDVTFYYRPLSLTAKNPPHQVLVGKSAEFGWFAILMDCGNLVTATPPKALNPEAACQKLTIAQVSPNRYRMTTNANKKDGATINGYRYEIKKAGQVVATEQFATANSTHEFAYEQREPGKYNVRATVLTSEGQKTNSDCTDAFVVDEKPSAQCAQLTVEKIQRSTISLTGKAAVANGATIKSYIFVVKDKEGKNVKRIVVETDKKNVTAENFELAPGTYTASLKVRTSVGEQTDDKDCVATFKVVKTPECPYNPSLPPSSPDCQPCPGNPEIWIKDESCDAEIVSTKTSLNMSQGNVDATKTTARASDKISYTLTIENRGTNRETIAMREDLTDVLEYAKLVDQGGGVFDESTKTVSWPSTLLEPGKKLSRTIAIQIMSEIPATNTGTSNPDSYDCTMINTFGNSVAIDVECAPEKVIVEQVVSELPQTGPRENMIFAALLLTVVTYFYARSRQLGREVRLIRRNLNTGTI